MHFTLNKKCNVAFFQKRALYVPLEKLYKYGSLVKGGGIIWVSHAGGGAVAVGTSAGAGPVSLGLLARLVLLLTCRWDEEQITHYQISH